MSIRGITVRKGVRVAPVVLGLILVFPLRSLQADAPRHVTSMTIQERMNLPGNIRVQLPGGRITTLAALREEHQRRMQRFTNANALAKAAHGRMPPISPRASAKSGQQQNPGGGSHPTVQAGPTKAVTLPRHDPMLDVNPVTAMVPSQYMKNKPLPRDYVAACTNATACLYLPGNTTFWGYQDIAFTSEGVLDRDFLIVDSGVCASDGGSMNGNGWCEFAYPVVVLENFKPAGKLSTTGQCDSPMQFTLDQMGAIKVWYDPPIYNAFDTFTSQNALTCTIQVWQ